MIADAPMPCNPLAITKVVNESDKAQINEVILNNNNPPTYTFLYPHRSPKEEKASREMVTAN